MRTILLLVFLFASKSSWATSGAFNDPSRAAKSSQLLYKLSAYWRFEEASGVRFNSAGSDLLFPTNAPTTVSGIIGNGANMVSASSQYFLSPSSSSLAFGDQDFSISAWVKLATKTAQYSVLSKYESSGNARSYLLYYNQTTDRFTILVSTNGTQVEQLAATTFGNISTNTWYNVVVVQDSAANTLAISVNGAQNTTNHQAGVLSNNVAFLVGALVPSSPASLMNGVVDEIGIWKRTLSLVEITNLYHGGLGVTFPGFYRPLLAMLDWSTNALTGTYTLATTQDRVVLVPNGAAPVEGTIATHRYHHHSKIWNQLGITYIAFSSGATNEDASGQQTVMCISTNKGTNWNAPFMVLGSQTAFPSTGASYEEAARITYPRNFQEYGGKVYVVAAIDETHGAVLAGLTNLGLALVASEVNSNGLSGSLFRISTTAYTPPSGTINYDGILGPPLLAYSILYGSHGGSGPLQPAVAWSVFITQNGINFAEPGTFPFEASGTKLFRIWRRVTTPDNRLYLASSDNAGDSFSYISRLGIPDSPGATFGLRITNGQFAVIGNPIDGAVNRDPLYLATFNSDGSITNLSAIRQGLSGNPTYAGSGKNGGAQYPGAVQVGNYLYVAYSIAKESIGFSRVLIPGLADNNND